MKRASSKKSMEKRKRAPSKVASTRNKPKSENVSSQPKDQRKEICRNCARDLRGMDRALFVEEEIGRIFCSESCIANYFSPEIAKLEKEYFKHLTARDLPAEEREKLAHLRWITLQEPDEIWREKTASGDYRYTLISEFQPEGKRIWSICICLFLRGEPSFLYIAFPTRSPAMKNYYRKGERFEFKNAHEVEPLPSGKKSMDGLASEWTEEETIRAHFKRDRREDDIPSEDYDLYQSRFEETLDNPDEVWSLKVKDNSALKLFHFIRYYSDDNPGVWYIIVARETDDQEELEILEAFPTQDLGLVDRYRRDRQELGLPSIINAPVHVVH